MTNGINKAVAFCRRRGIPYTVQDIRYGFQRVEISAETWSEYEATISAARKLRGIVVESHINTQTIWLYTSEAYETIRTRGNAIHELTEVFWQAIHAGKSQQEAHAEQWNYAEAHDLQDAFLEIYA